MDELIAASLPERSAGRELLFEVFRERFGDLPVRAFRQAGLRASRLEDFLEYFWRYERLVSSFMAYRRSPAGVSLVKYFFVKCKWLVRDYCRYRRRHREPLRLGDCESAAATGDPLESEGRESRVLAVRECVERLGPTLRIPFKLVHVRALGLGEKDWCVLAESTRRPRHEIEAQLARYHLSNRPTLALAEVAALMNRRLHTVGTYVARAVRAVSECVRRRLRHEEGA